MGGCVSAAMNAQNGRTQVDHSIIVGYRAYGVEASPFHGADEKPQAADESAVYGYAKSSAEQQEKLAKEFYDGPNWVARLQERVKEIPDWPALGHRPLERVEKRTVTDPKTGKEKVFEYYHCGKYTYITFEKMWKKMENFARGLGALGIPAKSRVTIYEETRWEWMVSMYGIWLQDMVAATVYANLGEDALLYALEETDSAAIVCNVKGIPTLQRLLAKRAQKPILIYLDDAPASTDYAQASNSKGFTIVSWTAVVKKGEQSQASVHIPSNNDDEALIMYTSGTTGNPKGVIHTHGSISAGIQALNHRLLDLYKPTESGEIYCAYLPLAHILEFALVNIILHRGSMVGFGSPRTLTDAFCIPHGDLREYNPQIIIAVPRVFDTIRKAAESKLPKPGTFKRTIFEKAFQSRRDALLKGEDTPYWNSKVFAAVRNLLGKNIFGMLSGGGPLSPSTQEFINVMCGGPLIIQGWGLTETICCGTTQRLGDLEPNCAGQTIITERFKLKDVADEYKHTDQPEPRGEILLRGPFLFKGYYKQPELTKEAIDEDGWFHTGDVGSLTKEGKLRIVGRVKALAKNVLGEYIALEVLESIYGQHELCTVNGVCVLVHPESPFICALVLTDAKRATAFAAENGLKGIGAYPEMLTNQKFLDAAAKSLAAYAKAAGRQGFECVKRVAVLTDEWTPENGLVTPTSKLRRSKVEEHYKTLIAELFKE